MIAAHVLAAPHTAVLVDPAVIDSLPDRADQGHYALRKTGRASGWDANGVVAPVSVCGRRSRLVSFPASFARQLGQ